MKTLLLGCALLALSAAATAAPDDKKKVDPVDAAMAKVSKQWEKEVISASRYTFECFGKGTDEGCQGRMDAFQRAFNAPDIDEGGRHYVLKDALHTLGVWGKNKREHGDKQGSIQILNGAYGMMMQHFEGGKHFHTIIENLPLQTEAYLTLDALGQADDAATVLNNARSAIDSFYGAREEFKGNKHQEDLLKTALVGSEHLETDIAKALEKQLDDLGDGGDQAKRDALNKRLEEAWRRAGDWIERATEAGVSGSMDLSPRIRMADARIGLGRTLMQNARRKEAEAAFREAALYTCSMVGEDFEQRMEAGKPFKHPEEGFANERCDKAAHGVNWADGTFDRIMKESFDRQWQLQMEIWDSVAKNGVVSPD
ncbi:MAG TPA: hypothetical protein VI381_01440 [Allosphingosinicella sp.]